MFFSRPPILRSPYGILRLHTKCQSRVLALCLRGDAGRPGADWPVRVDRPRGLGADFDVRDAARRDLQDLASICALPDFRRLMQAACLRLVQFLNQTGLGRDVGLPQPTVHR